ncbi:hypothetical protein [Modestobacter sp. KNN46-3]|uniref:hypothetical protein n=1 Tax=Modestobacter sp. KNN46-3 TaxID=2711218 RepID=UPI0013E01EA1|nr:hypothetical protein [Modestobacter sp. KNN46-3]
MSTPCTVCAAPAALLADLDVRILGPEVFGRYKVQRALADAGITVSMEAARKHLAHVQDGTPGVPAYPAGQLRLTTLDDAVALPPVPTVTAPQPAAPRGYEPGVRFEPGAKAAVVTLPPAPTAPGEGDCAAYLRGLGIDPDLYVLEPIEVRTNSHGWTRTDEDGAAVTQQTFFARFRVTRREPAAESWNVDELLAAIPELVADRPDSSEAPGESLLVGLADWQTGKRDQGGTEALVRRLAALGPAIVDRVGDLQLLGRNVETIYLVGLGDLVEGCKGFYPMQTFSVELDRRQQIRVARRMLTEVVKTVATLGIPVVVSGVAGNHGEQRNGDGKAFTTPGDNDDLLVLEQCAEVFALASGYDHVSFVIPDQELAHTMDLSGQHCVFTHGHVSRGGWAGLWTWFKNQRAHGKTSATTAVVGHYHHLHVENDGLLTLFQCPALEGGSDYFSTAMGSTTVPGTACALVSGTFGVRDLAVL